MKKPTLRTISTMLKRRKMPELTEAKHLFTRLFEEAYLIEVIKRAEGSVSEAARIAGWNRTNFRRLLQRHDIDPTRFKPTE